MAAFLYYDDIHKYANYFVKKYNSENEVKISLKYLYSIDNIEEKLQTMMEDENKKRKDACGTPSFEISSKGGKKTVELGIGIHGLSKEEQSRNGIKGGTKSTETHGGWHGVRTWEKEHPEKAQKQKSIAGKKGIKATWEYYDANPDKLEERNEGIRIAAKKRKDTRRAKELKIICKKIKTNDWFQLNYFNDKKTNIKIKRIGALLRESDDNLFEKKKNGNTFMYKLIKSK